MKVLIKNKTCNFSPRFNKHKPSDNDWLKQNQDNFKICTIGGERVFVKRFQKHAKFISGHRFLKKVKNKRLPFLPMTYDLITVKEDGKDVSYLFQEVLKGKTLDEVINNKNKAVFHFNPHRFVNNIYYALLSITKEGYWYSDFVEKNIFVGNDGNCYLIDLDSIVPLSILPNDDTSQVNRNYQIAVFTYWYRDVLKYDYNDIGNNLKGDTLNFLQLFIFIAQIKYYIEQNCQIDFLSSATRKSIPNYLLNKNDAFTKAIFKSCFEPTKNHQQILSLDLMNNYIKSILFPSDKVIKIDFGKKKIISGTTPSKMISSKKNPIADKDKNAIRKVEKLIEDDKIFESNELISSLSNKYPNDVHIKNLSNNIDLKIKNCYKLYKQAENCYSSYHNEDALNYINNIESIAVDFNKAIKLKHKIKDQYLSYKSQTYIILSEGGQPYECPNCKFPVRDEVLSSFNTFLFWSSILASTIIGFNIFSWIGLLLGIVGFLIWSILLSVLPKKWLYKEQNCDNCHLSYYQPGKKIED